MRGRLAVVVAAAVVATAFSYHAGAANFSPTTAFSLSNRKAGANPKLAVRVAQDKGEEEIAKVLLKIPAGFSVPSDAAVRNGEQLGEGEIEITVGPECAGAVGSMPYTTDVKIVERDRTSQEKAQGVYSVWVVDLRPVTTIDLLIKGATARGWELAGTVPQNSLTCAPFSFAATLFDKSAQAKVPIFRNASRPGAYVFQAIYESTEGSRAVTRQIVMITR